MYHRNSIVVAIVFATLVCASTVSAAEWGDLTGKFVYDGPPPTAPKIDVNKDIEEFGNKGLVDEKLLVDANGGIANVVVYVRTTNVAVNPDLEKNVQPKVVYDNKGGRFNPHVLTVWFDKQTVVLHNSDPVGHNSNLQPLADVGVNPLLPANSSVEYKFNRKQTVPQLVGCNIHPWMQGYILPRDNPYAAVSTKDGTFKIEKLPAGTELEFQVWQEKIGFLGPVAKEGQPPMTGTMKIEKDGKSTPTDWALGRFKLTLKPGANDLGTVKVAPKLLERK